MEDEGESPRAPGPPSEPIKPVRIPAWYRPAMAIGWAVVLFAVALAFFMNEMFPFGTALSMLIFEVTPWMYYVAVILLILPLAIRLQIAWRHKERWFLMAAVGCLILLLPFDQRSEFWHAFFSVPLMMMAAVFLCFESIALLPYRWNWMGGLWVLIFPLILTLDPFWIGLAEAALLGGLAVVFQSPPSWMVEGRREKRAHEDEATSWLFTAGRWVRVFLLSPVGYRGLVCALWICSWMALFEFYDWGFFDSALLFALLHFFTAWAFCSIAELLERTWIDLLAYTAAVFLIPSLNGSLGGGLLLLAFYNYLPLVCRAIYLNLLGEH